MKNKDSYDILLKCKKCKQISEYPLKEFKQAWFKYYKKNGFVPQGCCGDNEPKLGYSNTKHIIIGYVHIKERRMNDKIVLKRFSKLT